MQVFKHIRAIGFYRSGKCLRLEENAYVDIHPTRYAPNLCCLVFSFGPRDKITLKKLTAETMFSLQQDNTNTLEMSYMIHFRNVLRLYSFTTLWFLAQCRQKSFRSPRNLSRRV